MRYLTKSKFKLATECPTKLFYISKEEYADQSLQDPFLEALAEGGYQVGELAKAYHPDGHEIRTLNAEEALSTTNALLEREEVTIFEAAVRSDGLFVRIDILRKQGIVYDLIEVKAKSFSDEAEFLKKDGTISSAWLPYLMDVAFQTHVLQRSQPKAIVRPFLMLADKNAHTSVDGLNQKFKITRTDHGYTETQRIGDVSPETLGDPILVEVDVRDYVNTLQSATYDIGGQTLSFSDYVDLLAKKYAADQKIDPAIECGKCAVCSFKTTGEDQQAGKKSGYKECWTEALRFNEQDFDQPNVMQLWNFRKKQEFLETHRFFMSDLTEEDFDLNKPAQARQWLQVQKTVAEDTSPWIDLAGLKDASAEWRWPLHFIDFETSAVAIPFNRFRRPYEVVAFQFSHHIVYEDGCIEHADEYLNTEQGRFPNFDFVRQLKAALEKDDGTIFRYAPHENTVLNQIAEQLADSAEEIQDRIELIEWIKSITNNTKTGWVGPRDMVDLCVLVKKYYYQLDMGGSNSIKKVLPAILNSSPVLQEKYSKPIYNSRNYSNQTWIQRDADGRVKDPYKLLPSIFADISQDELERVESDTSLADGGAAMTAYARMQFTDMSEVEREAISKALLRYCELDTLAMVMIWEAWKDLISP